MKIIKNLFLILAPVALINTGGAQAIDFNGAFSQASAIVNTGLDNNIDLGTLTGGELGQWRTGEKGGASWIVDNNAAKVLKDPVNGPTANNNFALYQVCSVQDNTDGITFSFSFDFTTTAGITVDDRIGVSIYTWNSGNDITPIIAHSGNNVSKTYGLQSGIGINDATALITQDSAGSGIEANIWDEFVDDGLATGNQGGVTAGSDSGTYTISNLSIDAGDDRLAVIFSGRHKDASSQTDDFSISNVSISISEDPDPPVDPPSYDQPNILLIVIDDLNTWPLNNPTRFSADLVVPNLERLASRGVTFTRACTPATICVPARTAFVSGVAPWSSGVYQNRSASGNSPALQGVPSFFEHFHYAGYHTAKRGKVTHGYSVPGQFLSENSSGATRDPYPKLLAPGSTLENPQYLPLKGWGRYGPEKDWGVIDDPNNIDPVQEENMQDTGHANWAVNKISNYNADEPFLIALGFFHPHYPWHAPQKYFDMYPIEDMVLAPVNPTDQDDIPAMGRALLGSQHDSITANNDEIDATRAYLACISYVDAQIGRLLDALDASPHASNTIGDHGYHVGEKQHWFKATTWEESVNSLFIVAAPGVTEPNQVSPRMVSLLDLYPTMANLAGLELPAHLDGRSLLPLLENPTMEWDYPAISTINMHLSIASEDFRYIRYTDGTEELYDRRVDPHEWDNVANNVEYRGVKRYLNELLPAPEELAPPQVSETTYTLTLDLTVESSGPGGGYIQLSPISTEGISIIPLPDIPGPVSVNATFRKNRTVAITPVNFSADWQIGSTSKQDGITHSASSDQTIVGTLNYGSNVSSAYQAWANSFGGEAIIGVDTYDFDGDGLSNLMEFACGGDPTDPSDLGIKPGIFRSGENFQLVIPQRAGSSGIDYFVETIDDLSRNIWDTNQYLSSEMEITGTAFDNMSYYYSSDSPSIFFRVSVDSN